MYIGYTFGVYAYICMFECVHTYMIFPSCKFGSSGFEVCLLPQAGEDFVSSTLSRIEYSLDAGDAAAKSELVVEAIVENMAVKHDLFQRLDKVAPRYREGREGKGWSMVSLS